MKFSKILVGTGFLVGASAGLVIFTVRTTAKIGVQVVTAVPKRLTKLSSNVVEKIRHEEKLHHDSRRPSNKQPQTKSGEEKTDSGLSERKAQELAEALSAKPSIGQSL